MILLMRIRSRNEMFTYKTSYAFEARVGRIHCANFARMWFLCRMSMYTISLLLAQLAVAFQAIARRSNEMDVNKAMNVKRTHRRI